MGPVTSQRGTVIRVAVVLSEVVSVDVVDEAVAVVIDAVAGDLPRVGPQIAGEVGMGEQYPGVNHADADAAATGRPIPREGRLYVSSRRAGCTEHGLAGVLQTPDLTEGGIVRQSRLMRINVVRVGIQDARLGLQPPQSLEDRQTRA